MPRLENDVEGKPERLGLRSELRLLFGYAQLCLPGLHLVPVLLGSM